jgi:hypothetical protein
MMTPESVCRWSSAQIDRALAHIEDELDALRRDQDVLLRERERRNSAMRAKSMVKEGE